MIEVTCLSAISLIIIIQAFLILGKTKTSVTVPCCYYLLPNKEYKTYKAMFQSLKDGGLTAPKSFHCDFEAAIFKALIEVFPETEIICCDAHFKRAVRSHIQSNHLQSLYHTNVSFQTFVRYLWGLSLVPVEDIIKVWEEFVIPSPS